MGIELLLVIIALVLWLIWCIAHVAMMYAVKPNYACYTGFRIVIPEHYHVMLTPEECDAIRLHELGHKHHKHVWKNYLRVCVFIGVSQTTRQAQELEADDFVVLANNRLQLASALRKLNVDAPFDEFRILRLESIPLWVTP